MQYKTGCKICPYKKWATDNAFFPNTNKSWNKMKKAYEGFNNGYMVSVSDYIKKCAEDSPIVHDLHHLKILNGINTDIFKPTFTENIKEKYNIGEQKKICCFVTSAFSLDKNHLKGGFWLVKLAKKMRKNDYHFLVVGNDKIEIECDNISFLGRVNDKKLLANIYSQSDVSLSFSKSESFGMTSVESLCCGTPIVGFKCGGMESVTLRDYSRFSEYGDIDSIIDDIIYLTSIYHNRNREISKIARKIYSRENMAKKYYELYKKIESIH